MDDLDKRRYVELTDLKREAQRVIDECDAELGPLESALLDHMANVGMDRFRLDGHTVYIQETLWAWPHGNDHLAAVKAFRRLAEEKPEYEGLRTLGEVRINKNTLSKVFRDWERGGVEAPPELLDVIDLTRDHKLVVRRSGR